MSLSPKLCQSHKSAKRGDMCQKKKRRRYASGTAQTLALSKLNFLAWYYLLLPTQPLGQTLAAIPLVVL